MGPLSGVLWSKLVRKSNNPLHVVKGKDHHIERSKLDQTVYIEFLYIMYFLNHYTYVDQAGFFYKIL